MRLLNPIRAQIESFNRFRWLQNPSGIGRAPGNRVPQLTPPPDNYQWCKAEAGRGKRGWATRSPSRLPKPNRGSNQRNLLPPTVEFCWISCRNGTDRTSTRTSSSFRIWPTFSNVSASMLRWNDEQLISIRAETGRMQPQPFINSHMNFPRAAPSSVTTQTHTHDPSKRWIHSINYSLIINGSTDEPSQTSQSQPVEFPETESVEAESRPKPNRT